MGCDLRDIERLASKSKEALVMLNSLPSRGCIRMRALVRWHTHGSVAGSVYPFLSLGPPRGAPQHLERE